jgi:hypothetical protein
MLAALTSGGLLLDPEAVLKAVRAQHGVLHGELDVRVGPAIGASPWCAPVHHQRGACTMTASNLLFMSALTRSTPRGSL